MRGPMVAVMPSSSSSSRARACSAVSPGSILPPGNSHFRLMGWSARRWQTRTSVPAPFQRQIAQNQSRDDEPHRLAVCVAVSVQPADRVLSLGSCLFSFSAG